MSRLVYETECEHGFNGQHYPLGGDHSFCSGGSRIPLDPDLIDDLRKAADNPRRGDHLVRAVRQLLLVLDSAT